MRLADVNVVTVDENNEYSYSTELLHGSQYEFRFMIYIERRLLGH